MTTLPVDEVQPLTRLKALANDVRFELLRLLSRGECCVCDLEAALQLPQSKVSYHLAVLRDAGLVVSEQRGKNAYYRLLAAPLYSLGGELLQAIYLADLPLTDQTESVC